MDRMIRETSYGEVGIDTEASPGNGAYYAKHYESGFDMCGFETVDEALEELLALEEAVK